MDMAKRIAEAVLKAKGRTFYVGGRNRDIFMGKEPSKDIDMEVYFVTPHTLENILSEFAEILLVGRSFGVYKLKGYDIDIAFPRRETSTGSGHTDFDVAVDPWLPFEDACRRRDFTINAIMVDVLTGEVVDPFGGKEDIKHKTIRAVDEITFAEDPLRVYRAAQFAGRFGFDIEPKTARLCQGIDLSHLSKERVFGEFNKLLMKSAMPSAGFKWMRNIGILNYHPVLKDMIGCLQDPVHHPEGDVWEHSLKVLDQAAKVKCQAENPLGFMWAALLHDCGKPGVADNGRFYGHDYVGEKVAADFLKTLTEEKELIKYVSTLVRHHMQPLLFYKAEKVKDSAFRRLALKVGLKDLLLLSKCDRLGREGIDALGEIREIRWFEDRVNKLNLHTKPTPLIQGRDLIKLGVTPGPKMGKLLNKAFDLQLDGYKKEEIIEKLKLI
jgi:tRNA nucleotidyltransferase (CCA-adding enzyme)